MSTITESPTPAAGAQTAQQFVTRVRERVAKIVVGQDVVVERMMIAEYGADMERFGRAQ